MQKKQPVIPSEAVSFLEKFNYKKITYQLLRRGKPLKTFAGNIDKIKKKAIQNLSDQHTEFFFMVNEGDGEIHSPHKTCRSQASVTTLKSLYIDTDTCPFSRVKEYLKKCGIKPHFVVETSPGRYHVYLLINDTSVTNKSLSLWKACQLSLVYLGDTSQKETGCDLSMRDYSRILRIPGFYNYKREEPFKVTVKLALDDHEKYDLSDLYERLNGQSFLDSAKSSDTKPYSISQEKVSEGYRHPEMTSFIAHLLNKHVDKEIVKLAFYRYAEEKFDAYQDFLPEGKRHKEVIDFITYKEQSIKAEAESSRVETAKNILSKPQNHDPFELPDDFYFQAPGLIGDITKEICSKARYPIPSFAFGTAIATLGSLKARHVTSQLGHAPSNYFLCLSGTGSGKNYSQEVMSHTFSKLGIASLLSFGIRSEKGIARFLEINDSVGVLSLDEAEGFFNTLSDRYSPHYLRACKSLLLELFTSTNMPHKSLGQLGDKKQKPIVLSYPRLSILAYGVLHTLHESFDKKSIADGLLQRFIVLTNYKDRVRNHNFLPAASLNSNCFEELQHLAKQYRFNSEADFLASLDLEAELKITSGDEAKKEALEKKLESLLSKTVTKKTLRFTSKALSLYNAYSDSLDAQINREMVAQSGLEGLYSRAAEQVGRLATASATNEITETHIDYYVTFIDSRIKALRSYIDESFNGALASKCESLLQAVARLSQKLGRTTVSKREILRLTKFQSAHELNEILRFLVESGEILENKTRMGERGREALCYSLGAI